MDVHELGQPHVEQIGRVADCRGPHQHAEPEVRIETRQPADEQRRCGIGGENDALGKGWGSVVGTCHPVNEAAHHGDAGQHGEVGKYRQLHATGLGQFDRLSTADAPAHLGRADVGRYRRYRGEQQHMREVHVADGFFLAADFIPLLTGVGEQTPNVIDHASVSSVYGGRLAWRSSSRTARATLRRSIEMPIGNASAGLERFEAMPSAVIALEYFHRQID